MRKLRSPVTCQTGNTVFQAGLSSHPTPGNLRDKPHCAVSTSVKGRHTEPQGCRTGRGGKAALEAPSTASQTPTWAPRQSATSGQGRPGQARPPPNPKVGRQPAQEAGACVAQAVFSQWGPRTRPLLPGPVMGRAEALDRVRAWGSQAG